VVALLGGMDVAVADRVGKVAQQYGVPLITTSGLAGPPGENVFRLGLSASWEGGCLARVIAPGLQGKSLKTLLQVGSTAAQAVDAAAARVSNPAAETPLGQLTFGPNADLADIAKQLLKSHPETVLLGGDPQNCLKIRSQLQREKASMPVIYAGEEA